MQTNGIIPQLTLNDLLIPLELASQFWPPATNFPPTWPDQPARPAVGGTENQLVQELTYLYQVACITNIHHQRLQAIIRPLLSNTTWREAVKVARGGGGDLPTETREVTVLRLDIANFTGLMETHPLDQVLAGLNACLDLLTQIVYRHEGDIDKYLGDGFLALFANADDALRAGCALQQAIANFNHKQVAQEGPVFPTRIGLDSGPIAITSLGSSDRQDRTVIGMPVNLAERLQARARPGWVWLSQRTFERLQDRSGCRCLGPMRLKGRVEEVVVYEAEGHAEDAFQ